MPLETAVPKVGPGTAPTNAEQPVNGVVQSYLGERRPVARKTGTRLVDQQ